MNSNKSDAVGPDLIVQAYGIDRAGGRPVPWIRQAVQVYSGWGHVAYFLLWRNLLYIAGYREKMSLFVS